MNTFAKDTAKVYVCGPTPMINFVTMSLQNYGLDERNIKYEKWWQSDTYLFIFKILTGKRKQCG